MNKMQKRQKEAGYDWYLDSKQVIEILKLVCSQSSCVLEYGDGDRKKGSLFQKWFNVTHFIVIVIVILKYLRYEYEYIMYL